jgi:hypothetical protein
MSALVQPPAMMNPRANPFSRVRDILTAPCSAYICGGQQRQLLKRSSCAGGYFARFQTK